MCASNGGFENEEKFFTVLPLLMLRGEAFLLGVFLGPQRFINSLRFDLTAILLCASKDLPADTNKKLFKETMCFVKEADRFD